MVAISSKFINESCPYCQFLLDENNERVSFCPDCLKAYHSECWQDNNGCVVCNRSEEQKEDKATAGENVSMLNDNVVHSAAQYNRSIFDSVDEGNIARNLDNLNIAESGKDPERETEKAAIESRDYYRNSKSDIVSPEDSNEVIRSTEDKIRPLFFKPSYIAAALVVIFLGALFTVVATTSNLNNNDKINNSTENNIDEDDQDIVIVDEGPITWREGTYFGKMINNIPNGYGIWEGGNGDIYKGDWVNGNKEGDGSYNWKDGKHYSGGWKNDFRNGEGTWETPDGRNYSGGWKAGRFHGEGVYINAVGDKYSGDYLNDEKHGYGKLQYSNGDKYEGHFENGLYHGQGTKTFSDGRVLEGEWVESNFVSQPTAIIENIPITYFNACSEPVRLNVNGLSKGLIGPRSNINIMVAIKLNKYEIFDSGNRMVKSHEDYNFPTFGSPNKSYTFYECHMLTNTAKVPHLLGKTVQEAKTMITGAGLIIGVILSEYHPSAPPEQVIGQNPANGATVKKGSIVNIFISMGPPPDNGTNEENVDIDDDNGTNEENVDIDDDNENNTN